jgi:hypothetical protein
MRHPGRVVSEAVRPGILEQCDHGAGEGASAHIQKCRFVDHIIAMPGPQELQKVPPALGKARCKLCV